MTCKIMTGYNSNRSPVAGRNGCCPEIIQRYRMKMLRGYGMRYYGMRNLRCYGGEHSELEERTGQVSDVPAEGLPHRLLLIGKRPE